MDALAATFQESGYDMKAVLTTLFTSDFFKEAYFTKVKEPGRVGRRHPAPGRRRRDTASRLRPRHRHATDLHGVRTC